jgi:hypothetical protein
MEPEQPQSEQRLRFVLSVRPSGNIATETRSRTFPDALLRELERNDWNNSNFGTLGTCVSLQRFERSEAVEPFDRDSGQAG